MPIHANSIDAYKSLNIRERCALVLACYVDGAPFGLTDRQCMHILGFTELNQVRPRITELLDGGYLREIANTKCKETGKTVRCCTVTDKVITCR